MRFIPNNPPVQREMLREMGVDDLERLFDSIPSAARLGRPLALPPGMAETEQLEWFASLAGRNTGAGLSAFLGGGSYPHFIPLVADSLLQRGEFLTAYTPYQPEISQGTLQAMFEFQSFITTLTGMEVANGSMYDGASAAAEAVLMAVRIARGRRRVLVPASLHPYYLAVLRTYTSALPLKLEEVGLEPDTGRMDLAALERQLGDDVACVLTQQPNFFGVVEDVQAVAGLARARGALPIAVVAEALSMALLKPPGESGAAIVAGEAQSFGVPLYFGGPYLGFMACREEHVRQLPGRISGQTVDAEGRPGYVLTLATREQHIRREKATSNICTNQNLVMLSAAIYLTLMGSRGLEQAASQNVALLAYLMERLAALPGYRPVFSGPRFNEVTLGCPRPAAEIVAACLEKGIAPGIDLGRFDATRSGQLLVAVTETKNRAAIDALVEALQAAA